MLSFFRLNDPYRLLAALFVFAGLSLPLVFDPPPLLTAEIRNMLLGEAIRSAKIPYVHLYDDTPPLAIAAFGAASSLFERSFIAWRMAAWVIIFFQAAYLSVIFNRHRFFQEKSYLPTLLFCFFLFSFEIVTLSAELLGGAMLLAAFGRLADISFRNHQRSDDFIVLGFYLGLASLLVFSYGLLLPAILLSAAFFMTLALRNLAGLLMGFFFPHIVLFFAYYFWNRHDALWSYFYLAQYQQTYHEMVSLRGLMILMGSIVSLLIVFLAVLNNILPQLGKQGKQLSNALLLWMVASLVHLLWFSNQAPVDCLPLFLPCVYFITAGLLAIRQRWRAELLFLIALLCPVTLGTLARYGKIPSVDYTPLLLAHSAYSDSVRNKKVMVLCEDWGVYQSNTLGGFFLNWPLSAPLFQGTISYEKAACIAWSLQYDPPEVIIDPQGYLEPFREQIPFLSQRYTQQGDLYVQKKSY